MDEPQLHGHDNGYHHCHYVWSWAIFSTNPIPEGVPSVTTIWEQKGHPQGEESLGSHTLKQQIVCHDCYSHVF